MPTQCRILKCLFPYRTVKRRFDIPNRSGVAHECDRQTDGQTVGDSWVSFVRDVRRDTGLCSTGSVAVAEPLY